MSENKNPTLPQSPSVSLYEQKNEEEGKTQDLMWDF